jgi:hypothetical protein
MKNMKIVLCRYSHKCNGLREHAIKGLFSHDFAKEYIQSHDKPLYAYVIGSEQTHLYFAFIISNNAYKKEEQKILD